MAVIVPVVVRFETSVIYDAARAEYFVNGVAVQIPKGYTRTTHNLSGSTESFQFYRAAYRQLIESLTWPTLGEEIYSIVIVINMTCRFGWVRLQEVTRRSPHPRPRRHRSA